jgi:signal transduction histidine kinase
MVERAQLGGGDLQIVSSPGNGTTLKLDLPLHAAHKVPAIKHDRTLQQRAFQ